MFSDFSLIILAGGHGSRMGRDKALLTMPDGRTFLQHQLDKGRALGITDILLSGSRTETEGVRVIPDNLPDSGPLGGLEACLPVISHEKALVLGVDTPLVPVEELTRLMTRARSNTEPVTVLRSPDGLQPLIGVYDRSVLPIIREQRTLGRRKLLLTLERSGYCVCESGGAGLCNINTPADYAAIPQSLPENT